MRKAFCDALMNAARVDASLVFLTGDLGFQVFDEFREANRERYINVGVAEAQLISAAAGLAAEGCRAIAYSIASFATARPYEQIRYCVSYPNLPVTIVGAGRGFTYSTSGVSHHATDDIGLMSMLPNMTVVVPGDPTEVEQLFPQVAKLPGPSYFTVGRYGEPRYEAEEAPSLGRARRLRSGNTVAVFTTGEIAGEAVLAVDLLRKDGLTPALFQMHTVKPLDVTTLEGLKGRFEKIIVVEEHLPLGGLWSAMSSWMMENEAGISMKRIGPPDAFALGNLKLDAMRKRMGLDADSIAAVVRSAWPGN
jgi:transketolase